MGCPQNFKILSGGEDDLSYISNRAAISSTTLKVWVAGGYDPRIRAPCLPEQSRTFEISMTGGRGLHRDPG